MALPPSLAGAVQLTVACPSPAKALGEVGASGAVGGHCVPLNSGCLVAGVQAVAPEEKPAGVDANWLTHQPTFGKVGALKFWLKAVAPANILSMQAVPTQAAPAGQVPVAPVPAGVKPLLPTQPVYQ